MATWGFIVLWGACIAALISVVMLFATRKALVTADPKRASSLINLANITILISTLLLTLCVALILSGFFRADMSMEYVAKNYPHNPSALQWLYLISGLWGGREGSLLFWTWLISLYSFWLSYRRLPQRDGANLRFDVGEKLRTTALLIVQVILCAFLATLILSPTNNPFHSTPLEYLNPDGSLNALAIGWGMNRLLEHWAMVLHPPALFIGYAGLTLPFAFALAALIESQLDDLWVRLSQRCALFAWIFLSIGIGLGAVWAYVVLGWGGYWGWDPVENASLLSWLCSTALLHSMTVYKRKQGMKAWTLLLAALSFICVVLGTFITRSGIVQSVHAFADDKVSTLLFLSMMLSALLLTCLALIWRRSQLKDGLEMDSLFTKNSSYFFTNLILLMSAILIAYLTLAPALPELLPFGGSTISASSFNALARPVSILFLLLAALCPFLSWKKTDAREFWGHLRLPALIATLIFVGLLVFYLKELLPLYQEALAEGGERASYFTEQGPSWYYLGLALLGFFTGSLLICASAYILLRGVRLRMQHKKESALQALALLFKRTPSQAAGYLAHLAMGIMLIGLVGSGMFMQEKLVTMADKPGATTQLGVYELRYDGSQKELINKDAYFRLQLQPRVADKDLAPLVPEILISTDTRGQQFLHAALIHRLHEDLFVAFQGYSADNEIVMTVKINPLINLVWLGMILMIGAGILALLPSRR